MSIKPSSTIYLDVCCLNRPFDYQGDDKIRLETEAILIILSNIENKRLNLISSDIIDYEVQKIAQQERKYFINFILTLSNEKIHLDNTIISRAKQFEGYGIKTFDALHLASSENKADFFVTVDKDIIKKSKIISNLQISVISPIDFLKGYLEV